MAYDYLVKDTNMGPRSDDIRGEEIEIECRGLRFRLGSTPAESEKLDGKPRQGRLIDFCADIASDMRGPFGLGPTYFELVCRRSSPNVAQLKVGRTGTFDLGDAR